MEKEIRVLIVDDSILVRNILKDIFHSDPQLKVIGEAENGKEGVQLAKELGPDIITMDIQMPVMDGFEATEHIMAYTPTPILIFSSALDKSEQYSSFKAVSLGALDCVSKPDITAGGFEAIAGNLIRKVKMLSKINVISHIRGKLKRPTPPEGAAAPATGDAPAAAILTGGKAGGKYRLVALGASTGGPLALRKILSRFPAGFPLGILCVQHISRGFMESFTEWLGSETPLNIRIASQGMEVEPGTVYFAPDDAQMGITPDARISVDRTLPPWGEFKPSVNHLFKSVGENLGSHAIGVILTGMGSDGAEGMKFMHREGAHTVAQDQHTCLIFGMPKASIDNGGVKAVLPLDRIAEEIIHRAMDKE